MMRIKDMVSWQTETGDSVEVGDVTLAPQSQSLLVRWPDGGWVWNRPVAVLVERGGETERIPVVDVTRKAQVGLLGLAALFGLATLVLSTRRLITD
jgi:hypothetical protein